MMNRVNVLGVGISVLNLAAARVVSDASVVIITQASFEEKLAKADPFIRGLLNIFVKHIRNLQR